MVGLTLGQGQVNEEVIVTNVVTALQPSIAQAVADALRNLGGSVSSSGFAAGSSSGSAQGFNSFGSSSTSAQGFSAAGASASRPGGSNGQSDVGPVARPEYNYEFKVADEEEQTFISQSEKRDGDDVTGTYSYVDPEGSLITVNYQAGAMGFTQTVDKKEGAVDISARPSYSGAGTGVATGATSSSFNANKNNGFNSNSAFNSNNAFNSNSASSVASNNFSATTSSVDQSVLISQIIAALQPQISQAVNSAISRKSSFSRGAVQNNQASGLRAQKLAGDRLTPLFGN